MQVFYILIIFANFNTKFSCILCGLKILIYFINELNKIIINLILKILVIIEKEFQSHGLYWLQELKLFLIRYTM